MHLGNGGDDGDIFHEIHVTCGCDVGEGGGYAEITIQPRNAVEKRREMLKAQISIAQARIREAREDLANLEGGERAWPAVAKEPGETTTQSTSAES